MKNEFRKTYNILQKDVIGIITIFVESHPDRKVYVDDYRGNLVLPESEVIRSVEIIDDMTVAWYGLFEEDHNTPLDDLNIETLLNILDAVEEAINP